MTVKVAGLWERGWNTPIKEVELWEFPLRDFAVNEHIMVPVSGIENSYVTEVPNLGDWLLTRGGRGRANGCLGADCLEHGDALHGGPGSCRGDRLPGDGRLEHDA